MLNRWERAQGQVSKYKAYLGNSVYADFDGYGITLTTENGYPDDPRNKIYLEPQVLASLEVYKSYLRRLTEPEKAQ